MSASPAARRQAPLVALLLLGAAAAGCPSALLMAMSDSTTSAGGSPPRLIRCCFRWSRLNRSGLQRAIRIFLVADAQLRSLDSRGPNPRERGRWMGCAVP
jgi:hypothetical protein